MGGIRKKKGLVRESKILPYLHSHPREVICSDGKEGVDIIEKGKPNTGFATDLG